MWDVRGLATPTATVDLRLCDLRPSPGNVSRRLRCACAYGATAGFSTSSDYSSKILTVVRVGKSSVHLSAIFAILAATSLCTPRSTSSFSAMRSASRREGDTSRLNVRVLG